jgi:hypothetical protein
MPLYLEIGTNGQTWHVEAQEFGAGVQKRRLVISGSESHVVWLFAVSGLVRWGLGALGVIAAWQG